MSATSLFPRIAPLKRHDYRISVVMPVFNETESVRTIVHWLQDQLANQLEEIVIVISPRSSAESRQICDDLAAQDDRIQVHVQQQNPGVGCAFREGYTHVRGNVVLSIDSDGEMELASIPRMLDEMARGNYGLVIGSRWVRGGGFAGYSPFKKILNWGFQQLFRIMYSTNIHDLTYGFKLLRAEVVHGIEWEATLHEIGCETTLKPIFAGVTASEVPSTWTRRVQGRSTNNFWRNFRYVRTAWNVLRNGVIIKSPNPADAETYSPEALV